MPKVKMYTRMGWGFFTLLILWSFPRTHLPAGDCCALLTHTHTYTLHTGRKRRAQCLVHGSALDFFLFFGASFNWRDHVLHPVLLHASTINSQLTGASIKCRGEGGKKPLFKSHALSQKIVCCFCFRAKPTGSGCCFIGPCGFLV